MRPLVSLALAVSAIAPLAAPGRAADLTPSAQLVLGRMGYGPRPGEVRRLEAEGARGVRRWIERQLAPAGSWPAAPPGEPLATRRVAGAPPGEPLATRLARLDAIGMPLPRLLAAFPPPEEVRAGRAGAGPHRRPEEAVRQLAQARVLRAVYGERQLDEVMTDFWFNHFNVSARKGPIKWLVVGYERDVIRPRSLGKFRDVLGAVARSPAMLIYLDNASSVAEAPRPAARPASRPGARADRNRRGLNENYARELLELHTLGVDGGYTQRDVRETARILTGWSVARSRNGIEFQFRPRAHDRGQKTVLGQVFPAGGGAEEGERLLDLLAGHPATARFIATKLVRHFVSDEVPPDLVDRAAARFRDTGGDIRETVRLIVLSPEFAASAGQKTKSPFEFVASALRATDADTDGGVPVQAALHRLGQPPYICQAPTGYPDKPDLWATPGGLITRLNFATLLAANRLPGTRVDLAALWPAGPGDGRRGADPLAMLEGFSGALLGGDLSDSTRGVLEGALADFGPDTRGAMVALLLGSPEFQAR